MMISRALRACPVCEHRQIEPLHNQQFVVQENHPLSAGYVVAHCATCGFVYADVAASQADNDTFYATLSKYDDAATSTGSGDSPNDRERLAGTAEILSGVLPHHEVRILDIGCAGGGLLYALQQRGYRNLAAAIAGTRQPILIGTTLHHREIVAQIEKLGLTNPIVLLPEGGPKFYGEAHS